MRPSLQGAPKYDCEAHRKSHPNPELHGPALRSYSSRWPKVMRDAPKSTHDSQ
jgi:hypothetical protein